MSSSDEFITEEFHQQLNATVVARRYRPPKGCNLGDAEAHVVSWVLKEDQQPSLQHLGLRDTLIGLIGSVHVAQQREAFNERQRDMINRLLDGFEGKLTSSKWATIEKCSQDTALRDISDLLERRILQRDEGGGRSTSYSLAIAARQS